MWRYILKVVLCRFLGWLGGGKYDKTASRPLWMLLKFEVFKINCPLKIKQYTNIGRVSFPSLPYWPVYPIHFIDTLYKTQDSKLHGIILDFFPWTYGNIIMSFVQGIQYEDIIKTIFFNSKGKCGTTPQTMKPCPAVYPINFRNRLDEYSRSLNRNIVGQ